MRLLIDQLVECGAVKFGDFTLTSGRKSKYYVDIKKASSRPEILREITREFIDMDIECDKVAGVELGAVALIVSYALETGKPFLIIRKGGREHGTKKRIEGEILPGERILLLEDVVTSGGSVVDAIDNIKKDGGKIAAVLSVVDREEGGTEKVSQQAPFFSLVRARDLLEMAERN